MPSINDDRRAFLIQQLGLSLTDGAKQSLTDLEVLYDDIGLTAYYPAVGITPTFLNSTTPDSSNPPRFKKDTKGVVHGQGRLLTLPAPGGVAPNSDVILLPVGYRPIMPMYVDWLGGYSERGLLLQPTGIITALDAPLNGALLLINVHFITT